MEFQNKIVVFDQKSTLWIRKKQNRILEQVFLFFSLSGESYVWITVALSLIGLSRFGFQILPAQEQFIKAMSVALVTLVVGKVIKEKAKRRRPIQVLENLNVTAKTPKDPSFPSSHTATSVSFFVALLVLGHPLAAEVGAWSAFVSISRFYLGVHFFSDVVVGALLGAVVGVSFAMAAPI